MAWVKGSKFTVCLNVHTNDADATGPPVAKFEPMLQPIRYRILVVDDNPNRRRHWLTI